MIAAAPNHDAELTAIVPLIRKQARYFANRVRRFDAADDFEQIAWVSICNLLPRFDASKSKLSTWAQHTARFAILEHIREASGVKLKHFCQMIPFASIAPKSDGERIDFDPVDRRQNAGRVAGISPQFLRNCRTRDALILVLYFDGGMTHRQIGNEIGVGESRVGQIFADLIKRLRRQAKANTLAAA